MALTIEPIELARLEEARQAHGVAELCSEAEWLAGGVMTYDAPDSWANQAVGIGLDGPVSGSDLDRLVSWFRERDATPRIEIAAHAHESLIKGLSDRGFVVREFDHVYAMDLEGEAESILARVPNRLPQSYRVERFAKCTGAAEEARVAEYIDVATSGFPPRLRDGGSLGPITDEASAMMRRIMSHERTTSFVAIGPGEIIVGTAQMEVAGEVCCVFGMSVLPAHRRRGVQQAVLAERFATAAKFGARWGVVASRPGIATERNARRLGCELVYAKAVLEQQI